MTVNPLDTPTPAAASPQNGTVIGIQSEDLLDSLSQQIGQQAIQIAMLTAQLTVTARELVALRAERAKEGEGTAADAADEGTEASTP